MAKTKKSEEVTKGLTADKLRMTDGYPISQNVRVNGITWFKEDSYKGSDYDWLSDVFSKASKKQTLKSKGTPDYMVVKEQSNVIVVIECKGNVGDHINLADVEEYKTHGYGSAEETENFAVNGALWYASFLCDNYDVVAIGISGQTIQECKVTSFVWPKGGNIVDIELLEDTYLEQASLSIAQYENDIEVALNRYAETEEAVRKTLRRYTLSCANFLRQNGIEDNSKAGFVSAIILGLTNKESKLYIDTKNAIEKKNATRAKKMLSDPIGSCFIQRYPFYTSQNVAILEPLQDMSIYAKFFIAHLVRFESANNYKAFARELNAHIKTDFAIKLPVNENRKPDFCFMDRYIKSLSYSCRL